MRDKNGLERQYQTLSSSREAFLSRARKCAALSIPSLITSKAVGAGSLQAPWQSMAARCVNNLASKLMLALLPPNMPFFRLVVQMKQDPTEEGTAPDGLSDTLKSEVERGLSKIERIVVEHASSSADRVVVHEALKHLIVCGNAMLYVPASDKPTRCFHLQDYVVKRAPNGEVLKIIVKESLSFDSLPDKVKALLEREGDANDSYGLNVGERGDSAFRFVDVYTGIERDEVVRRWNIKQECCGHVIQDSRGTYPIDSCPWIPMRFIRVDGEDYGRSYVEEYYGDISSLDALYQALIEGAAALAKVVFMLNPNSTTKAEDLSQVANLGFVTGQLEDVGVLQLGKYGDFRVAKEMVTELERRLAHAFILNSAIQRDGERVTAEEIRRMVEDLEAALGGVYSLMAVEFQLPYVKVRLKQLEEAGILPQLPEGTVKPAIVTGVEALGRGNDKTRLIELGQAIQSVMGPDALARLINPTEYLRRLITASGIDEKGLLVDPQELQQGQEQTQTMGLVEKLGPEAMKLMGGMVQNDPGAAQAALAPVMDAATNAV